MKAILDLFLGSALISALIALVGSFLCYRNSKQTEDPVLKVHKKKVFEVVLYWTVLVLCVVILWNFSKVHFLTVAGQ